MWRGGFGVRLAGAVYDPYTVTCTLSQNIPWMASIEALFTTLTPPSDANLPQLFNQYFTREKDGLWSVAGACLLSGGSSSPQTILEALSASLATLCPLQGLGLTLEFLPSPTYPCSFTITSNSTVALSQVCILLASSDYYAAASSNFSFNAITELDVLTSRVGLNYTYVAILGATILDAVAGSGVAALGVLPGTIPFTKDTSSPAALNAGHIVAIFLASLVITVLLFFLTLRLRKRCFSSNAPASRGGVTDIHCATVIPVSGA